MKRTSQKNNNSLCSSQASSLAASPRLEWLWNHFAIPALLIAFPLCLLILLEFQNNVKELIIGCCLLSLVILCFGFWKKRYRERFTLPVLAVIGYFLLVGLSVCWACSGKFFLREYSKLLFALPVFLFIVFCLPRTERAVHNLLLIVCSMSAIFAFFGVDLASGKLTWPLISKIPHVELIDLMNDFGTRLPGVFANSNISGGVHALGLLLTCALFDHAEGRFSRAWISVLGSMQTYMFFQGVNRSAIVFLFIALLVCFFVYGKSRIVFLLHLLNMTVPSLFFSFLALNYYSGYLVTIEGIQVYYPLFMGLAACAITCVLELFLFKPVSKIMERHNRLAFLVTLCVGGAFLVYVILGITVSSPLDLREGATQTRAVYPGSGSYVLHAETDDDVHVLIYSCTTEEVTTGTRQVLYDGDVAGASFVVPEASRIVYLAFTSPRDTVLTHALIRGEGKTYRLHLDYPLLPGQIAKRITGIWASQNLLNRFQFFHDGMKIFRDYPIAGSGLGAFESLIAGYQEYRYITRYVHNHYIQVLIDSGLLGLLAYLFLLVSCFLCILQGRKKDAPFHALFSPVLAAFLMLVLQSALDVIMSTTAYLPFAYMLFALCALCWGKPLTSKWLPVFGSLICAVLTVAYTVLISLNISAYHRVLGSTNSSVKFFSALDRAIKIDAFEYVDWKVSYFSAYSQAPSPEYKATSDQYATELLDVPSNSLHMYLIHYYLDARDYDMALLAAQKGAAFNYADNMTWNQYFLTFNDAAEQRPEDKEKIHEVMLSLYDDFNVSTSQMLKPIYLSADVVKLMRKICEEAGRTP